jgi:flagellar brake protein
VNEGLNIDEIEDRFSVRGRMEILNVLNDLIHRCEPVTVIFGGNAERLPTRLLEAHGNVLIFEPGLNDDANARLLKCDSCSFIASPDGIRVHFAAGQATRVSWGGSRAFCVPLPEFVVRVQRQESYRIFVGEQALTVRLFSDEGTALGEWPLRDLSVGGLGITIRGQSPLALCKTVVRVSFSLPQYGSIECPVVLRHATGANGDEPNPPYRIGLMFSALPSEMGAAIQRYIIEQEQQRRSRITDHVAGDHD